MYPCTHKTSLTERTIEANSRFFDSIDDVPRFSLTMGIGTILKARRIIVLASGKDKKEAISEALGTSISSIAISGLCFFGATFGVGVYSQIEMIGTLCTLMSRGAIVSMICVITILPSFLMIFDKIICKTTIGMKVKK